MDRSYPTFWAWILLKLLARKYLIDCIALASLTHSPARVGETCLPPLFSMACHFLGIFLFRSSEFRTNSYPLWSAQSRFPQSWTTWKKGAWRMNRQWRSVLRAIRGQQRKRPVRRYHPQLE